MVYQNFAKSRKKSFPATNGSVFNVPLTCTHPFPFFIFHCPTLSTAHLFSTGFSKLNFFLPPSHPYPNVSSHCCTVFFPFPPFPSSIFPDSINAPILGGFFWPRMRHEATTFSSSILIYLQDIFNMYV